MIDISKAVNDLKDLDESMAVKMINVIVFFATLPILIDLLQPLENMEEKELNGIATYNRGIGVRKNVSSCENNAGNLLRETGNGLL